LKSRVPALKSLSFTPLRIYSYIFHYFSAPKSSKSNCLVLVLCTVVPRHQQLLRVSSRNILAATVNHDVNSQHCSHKSWQPSRYLRRLAEMTAPLAFSGRKRALQIARNLKRHPCPLPTIRLCFQRVVHAYPNTLSLPALQGEEAGENRGWV
jgi:hypothetical protein